MRIAEMEAIPVGYPEPNDFDATRTCAWSS